MYLLITIIFEFEFIIYDMTYSEGFSKELAGIRKSGRKNIWDANYISIGRRRKTKPIS